ncbi:aminotransferase class V-fold PLP-dependent enzyme [candidate division WOR-3 bacterium]|uniref:Aminotransferase class V-fold PLP-dependent enzyme n=1 Tax=candidate division WOR-3 bacterium TaxID=2052148 RepID=A0A9D5QC80_UNCW3|nr:aminotransferase class V-fold PLP-dependent enzyme [candidate division WOR-3 bacterium]MBD3363746.1 aminotransferase class V-fold PLP-dependent enzyme [candidate division WOR-3 bacterium]
MKSLIEYREVFPSLKQKRAGKPPIYFDNACMTLKPQSVIDATVEYYTRYPACGERSTHWFAAQVDEGIAKSREAFRELIGARSKNEIIFTKNTTESINLVAQSIKWNPSDVVLTTDKEHNSNLCPWQEMATRGFLAKHRAVPSDGQSRFDVERFRKTLEEEAGKVRMVSLGHTSNLDGTSIPAETIREVVSLTKQQNPDAFVFLDAAQSVPHKKVKVTNLGVDFIAFSVHKMCGPTGVGVLYGRREILNDEKVIHPFIVGGGTVEDTHLLGHPLYFKPPHKFEAGLQNYAGIIAAGAAARFLIEAGPERIAAHEEELNIALTERMRGFPEVRILGPEDPVERSGIITFYLRKPATRFSDDEPDIDEKMDARANIMIRKGTFCVHSWYHDHERDFDKLWPGFRPTLFRTSLYLYNTLQEVEIFADVMKEILAELSDLPTLGDTSV